MALAVSITKIIADGQNSNVYFNIVASGSYTTTGDTLDLAKATQDATFQGMSTQLPSSIGPVSLNVWDAGGNIANGVFPVMGTTPSNNKVKFTSAFNTELSAGAYPGSLTGAKLQGRAIFHSEI